jgi:hypothetical protein
MGTGVSFLLLGILGNQFSKTDFVPVGVGPTYLDPEAIAWGNGAVKIMGQFQT